MIIYIHERNNVKVSVRDLQMRFFSFITVPKNFNVII